MATSEDPSTLSVSSAQSSTASTDVERDAYNTSGHLLVGIWHEREILFIRVLNAKKLHGYNTYVKVKLFIGDSKPTKVKTAVRKLTRNPVYKELLQMSLASNQIIRSTLNLSIWDKGKLGKNTFLGESELELSSLGVNDPQERWYHLKPKDFELDSEHRGHLIVSMKYDKKTFKLFVEVKRGVKLITKNPLKDSIFFATVGIIPGDESKKTKDVLECMDPVWNEVLEFANVLPEYIKTNYMVGVSIWTYDEEGQNELIGSVLIGPTTDSGSDFVLTESGASHWSELLFYKGQWIEAFHNLRSFAVPNSEVSETMDVVPDSEASETVDTKSECTKSEDTLQEQEKPTKSKKNKGNLRVLFSDESVEESKERLHQIMEERRSTLEDIPEGKDTVSVGTLDSTKTLTEQTQNSDTTVKDDIDGRISLYSNSEMLVDYSITGKILIRMEHMEHIFSVVVFKAEGLAAAESRLSSPYVRVYLLHNGMKIMKFETVVKDNTLDPVFNQKFKFNLMEMDLKLSSCALMFSVWHSGKGTDKFLGEFRVNPEEYKDDNSNKWFELLEDAGYPCLQNTIDI